MDPIREATDQEAGPLMAMMEKMSPRPTHRRSPLPGLALLALMSLSSCTHWFFSGIPTPQRTRPVARIETRGGVEYGATTRHGILFLGRTATSGPCRVHYYLGRTPVVEDGVIEPAGGIYYRAAIDLKHQNVHLIDRDVTADDQLMAIRFEGDDDDSRIDVEMVAETAAVSGDLLVDPGLDLPVGTGLFTWGPKSDLLFVGLVAAEMELDGQSYLSFAGVDRARESLITATQHPSNPSVVHRPDGISVIRR